MIHRIILLGYRKRFNIGAVWMVICFLAAYSCGSVRRTGGGPGSSGTVVVQGSRFFLETTRGTRVEH